MTHDRLSELLHNSGFTTKPNKGDGVLHRTITNKFGEEIEIVALLSAKDSSLLIYKFGQVVPVKIKFGRNYQGAWEFIADYVATQTNNSQGVTNHVSNSIQ